MKQVLFAHRYFLFFLPIFIGILIFFHFKGIIYYDEGYILNSGLRIAHGQIPYRDFDLVYTPIASVITATYFKLFGESVFAGRLVAFSFSLTSLFALYKILKYITKNTFLIIVSLLFFIAWGPTHINFPWPTMVALCFFLSTLFFYLTGVAKKNSTYFYFAGIMSFLTFLAKQNFGIGIIAVSLLIFFFNKLPRKKILLSSYLLGIGTIFLILLAIGMQTASLIPFFDNLYIYTFKRILVDKVLDTPFIYEGSLLTKCAKLIFYFFPFLLSITGGVLTKSSQKKLFIIPLFVAVFYLLGIRPTTDYNHFVPLLALSCLPLTICIEYVKNNNLKKLFIFLLMSMMFFGFYTAYFKSYYKWDPPLRYNTAFDTNPRIHVYLQPGKIEDVNTLVTYIDKNTSNNESIYLNFYAPIIYFLTNRENPTRYDLPSTIDIPIIYQTHIVDSLEKKKTKIIIIAYANRFEKSLVSTYIKKQYHVKKRLGDFLIFQRNSTK